MGDYIDRLKAAQTSDDDEMLALSAIERVRSYFRNGHKVKAYTRDGDGPDFKNTFANRLGLGETPNMRYSRQAAAQRAARPPMRTSDPATRKWLNERGVTDREYQALKAEGRIQEDSDYTPNQYANGGDLEDMVRRQRNAAKSPEAMTDSELNDEFDALEEIEESKFNAGANRPKLSPSHQSRYAAISKELYKRQQIKPKYAVGQTRPFSEPRIQNLLSSLPRFMEGKSGNEIDELTLQALEALKRNGAKSSHYRDLEEIRTRAKWRG